ncbi:MAG: DUF2861 family protein [Vibrio sp.]|uniref:DUF2861 family protein n=1 Tax=Vibrio TaxID=662 RepID=UPI001EBA4430|nr:DUF2861 family protein [Vibrio sp.]NRB69081.1 DUF2861 family protein [Vibrio sp.]
MIYRLLYVLCILFTPPSVYANWFDNTPLARTYEALLRNQSQLAWQELHLALNQHSISREFWLPIKQEIMQRSQCGRQLVSYSKPLPADLSLSFVRRSGLSSQGFQVKLSAENVNSALEVELISPVKKAILRGLLSSQPGYQEIESKEMLQEPKAGIYRLKLNGNDYDLVVAIPKNSHWLTLDNITQRVIITPPVVVNSCAKPVANWQWFSHDYTLLNKRTPIQQFNVPFPNKTQQPKGAKHLSASVSIFEYQQGLKVEYIQRLAIPFSP